MGLRTLITTNDVIRKRAFLQQESICNRVSTFTDNEKFAEHDVPDRKIAVFTKTATMWGDDGSFDFFAAKPAMYPVAFYGCQGGFWDEIFWVAK